ncbi:hypothetical protein [Methylomonas sp. MK1]|uniref:hypothetical protein n=1 Tax=Methylomonas sp. MK1 TaxID=1131552 RepID=UPI000370CB3C|nr:hypothetical protein [Methylomonas sp. MK1]
MTTIFHDGKLTRDEALGSLRLAAQRATESLPAALSKCEKEEEKHKIIGDRDIIVLAYLNSLNKSLLHTGPLFEETASNLEKEAEIVGEMAKSLKDTTEAINLFAGLLQLAAALAVAFA